ncbi:MAG: hypothetical protein BVN29_06960 [Nitrospira sp. ST-bin5]|nr:MAG: hypothetical protein BVN29_06960 [Nitrospira sp. ST-bin5]
MRTQTQVEGLIKSLYRELGGHPADLIQIKPIDGGWDNALSYEVTRNDKTRTSIHRSDLDDRDNQSIMVSLQQFS